MTSLKSIIHLVAIIFFLSVANSSFAYDANTEIYYVEADQGAYWQSPEEQQRIRELRLQQWNQQQASQNTSFNQEAYQEVTPQVAPEAGDLFAVAMNGNSNQIRGLLSQGLDINVSNGEGETALHMAASRGHYSTVIFLVENGAYVNARTVKNWIPLHHAVRFRHPNIVNYLVNQGSSTGARTSDGLSAIDIANNIQDYRILSILGAR